MKLLLFGLVVLCPLLAVAQNEQDLAEGKALFRSNCAFCHGLTGSGGRGPTLISGRFLHGSTDQDLKNVIRDGIPGTTMPSFQTMDERELAHLVQYIRHLSGSDVGDTELRGDPHAGRQVYQRGGCAGCHRIGESGSIYGPELTRVGAARSRDYLREAIAQPSADIPEEYQGVTVVTREGKRITGLRVNEDTFTVQLRDPSGNFRMFQKEEVSQVIHRPESLMPAYRSLPPQDLDNLVAYLQTLKGNTQTGAAVKKAEGIR